MAIDYEIRAVHRNTINRREDRRAVRSGSPGGGGGGSYTRRRRRRQLERHPRSSQDASTAPQDYEYRDQYILDSGVSAEWSGVTGGPPAEVVVRLHPHSNQYVTTPSYPSHRDLTYRNYSFNISDSGSGSIGAGGAGASGVVVVRAEEALIVTFVLLLWVAAIALFFNRWGKIRMLEPYQPKFQQQHRTSCPLETPPLSAPVHHRPSLSRGCGSCGDYGFGGSGPTFQQCAAYQPCTSLAPYVTHRPRQNSVFVGSTGAMALIPESPPRRSRSVADLPALLEPAPMPRSRLPSPRASRASSLHMERVLGVAPSTSHYLTVTDV